MVKFPCYQCPDRVLGCWNTCEKYLAAKKQKEEENISRSKSLMRLKYQYAKSKPVPKSKWSKG